MFCMSVFTTNDWIEKKNWNWRSTCWKIAVKKVREDDRKKKLQVSLFSFSSILRCTHHHTVQKQLADKTYTFFAVIIIIVHLSIVILALCIRLSFGNVIRRKAMGSHKGQSTGQEEYVCFHYFDDATISFYGFVLSIIMY